MYGIRQYLTHIVDKSRSEDDLQLVPCDEDAFDKIHILDRLRIRLVVVLQNEAQTCRAVGNAEDIVAPAGKPYNFC